MATKTEIKFISEGFKQILNSPGVQAVVEAKASEIQANANAASGEHFKSKTWQGSYGGGRWIGSAFATEEAEAEHKSLSGAVR